MELDKSGQFEPLAMFSDFISGYVGGLAGVVIGHPFDTVKVYIQTKRCELGAIGTLKMITREEGVQGLFKGITSPLFGTAFLCSILFGVNGVCTKTLNEDVRSTPRGQFIAGSVAGMSQSVVTCPIELVKIRMQLENAKKVAGAGTEPSTPANPRRTTLTQQTMRILREKAGYKTLFRGMAITLLRDIPGYGVYFATNQYILNKYKQSSIERNLYNDMMCQFVAGGLAGVASWVPSYPFDVVKTRIQGCVNSNTDTRFLPYTRALVKAEGVSVLTRGMSTQLVRAFPVNAFTFCGAAIAASILNIPSPFLL